MAVSTTLEIDNKVDEGGSPDHSQCTKTKEMSELQYEGSFFKELQELKLDASVLIKVLNDKLGIETTTALREVGSQSYSFLVQFLRSPKERNALREFLHVNENSTLFKKSISSKEWLPLLEAQVRTLKKFETEEKSRLDEEVQKVEDRFRKMLIVPESAWISKEALALGDMNNMMEKMLGNIRDAVSYRSNLDEKSFLIEKGSSLKIGVCTTDNPCRSLVRGDILSSKINIHIDFPLRSQYCEQIQFESKKNEEDFFEQLKLFGCSLLNEDCSGFMLESEDIDERYCSTVKYCFMPMAVCFLDNHQLLLSEDALSQLEKIQAALQSQDAIQIEKQCKSFFNQFGSHVYKGPFHFGGIFWWKCFSVGYEPSEKPKIQELQEAAIHTAPAMDFSSGSKILSTMGGNFPHELKKLTFIETSAIGGPSGMVGFPDWNYCLTRCNRTWQLIDRGISQVPVWDIISMNHANDFIMSECLAKEMKHQWENQRSIKLKDAQFVAQDGLPQSVTPVTVVETIPPLMHCNDFDDIFKHFKTALEVFDSQPRSKAVKTFDDSMHPQKAIRATLKVEKAVSLLRHSLLEADRQMEDCLLVTILSPLEYLPEKRRFSVLLAKSDVEYLCDNSKNIYEEFMKLQGQNSQLKVQSYLFYITIFHCDRIGARKECFENHIKYLEEKLVPLTPEIASCLQTLQMDEIDCNWTKFQSQMELFKSEEYAPCHNIVPQIAYQETKEKELPDKDLEIERSVKELFTTLGLTDYFPQKLSLHDALEIRDVLSRKSNHNPELRPFIMLQKIMMFDPKCRMGFSYCDNDDKNNDDSEDDDEDSIHPIDCLLALLHCSDNFLRQDLLCRLATCQLAVPLLLPHPHSREPTLLLWAMRSIEKQLLLHNETPYSYRIVDFPTAFVSIIRVGNSFISKSEILNGVFKAEHDIFLPCKDTILANGLVEVAWCVQNTDSSSVPTVIAYVNLHGDGSNPDYGKQFGFLCHICSVHVVLLDNTMLEDAKREDTISVLKRLSKNNAHMIIVQEGFHEQIAKELKDYDYVRYDRGAKIPSNKIRRAVKKAVKKSSSHNLLAELKKIAKQYCISTDEDGEDCIEGTKLANQVYNLIKKEKNPKHALFVLQSNGLWYRWAELHKELYRQKMKNTKCTLIDQQEGGCIKLIKMTKQEYGEIIQTQLKTIRHKQFELSQGMNTMMDSFVKTLEAKYKNEAVTSYFMLLLKMKLDDLSKTNIKDCYDQVRREGNVQEGTKYQELEMEVLSADFGLEHLLREISQIYEAVLEQTPFMSPRQLCLPQIAAQLMFYGFPIEIYDGDASYMPQKWISAVLNSLSDIVSDSPVITISVLGIQSTGKSTLLNTLFGARFSVGAGRCTRGAFMQLIPVHNSMWEKIGARFLLIIDTEGLRAPSRGRLDAYEYDCELATFVIGMADLTLITVIGEVLGEMENILNTATHAILRMSGLQLNPSCFIIHQHLPPNAHKKLLQGYRKTKKNFDKSAQLAAKETGRTVQSAESSFFITLDFEKDIACIPHLWIGTPPIARVSVDYSQEVQKLKCTIMAKHIDGCSIDGVRKRLEGLWNCILQEDYAFRFKDIFEIDYYRSVDIQYAKWSWEFRREMIEWENTAQNKLMSTTDYTEEQLSGIYEEVKASLREHVNKTSMKYTEMMNEFFKNNEKMSAWMQLTERRLHSLYEELKQNSEKYCKQFYQLKKDRAAVEKKKEELRKDIVKRVQQLANEVEKQDNDKEVMKKFNECWKDWTKELTDQVRHLPLPDIPKEVELTLTESFNDTERSMFLSKKLKVKPLEEWGKCLELTIDDTHLRGEPNSDLRTKAQKYTNQTLIDVKKTLKEKLASEQNFNPQFTTKLLHILKKREEGNNKVAFTNEYHIDIALTVCGHAIPVFKKIAKAFWKKYDPFEYIEREIKPHLEEVFESKYKEVANEKVAPGRLCVQLKKPLQKCVFGCLMSRIGDEMRKTYSWMETKRALTGRILLEIGQLLEQDSEKGFDYCIEFLTNAEESLQFWVKYFTETHCESASCLANMTEEELSKNTEFLVEKAKIVTSKMYQTFSFSTWMKEFHEAVGEIIQPPSESSLCLLEDQQEINNAAVFMEEFEKGLRTICGELKISKYSEIEHAQHEKPMHVILYEEISGCTDQCPFCKAQCEYANKEHLPDIKHYTAHRPQCFGNFRWAEDSTMMLLACPHLVVGHLVHFRNEKTDQEWIQYRDYKEYYPDWNIPEVLKFKVSIYWKWFIAKYHDRLMKRFKFKETKIPQEWKTITWTEVEKWLKIEYEL